MRNISLEEFEEARRIAYYTFNKFFNGYQFFKEDMVADCLAKLPNIYEKYNSTQGSKTSYFCLCFRRIMFRSLGAEFGWGHFKKKIETVSLETPTVNGEDVLGSFIPDNTDLDENLNFEFVKNCLKEIYNEIRVSKHNRLTKPIIKLICQGYIDNEIAKKLNCSRELPRQVRLKLASLLKTKLEDKGYIF